MSSPTRSVSDRQMQAFGLALCDRLGLDPAMVSDDFHCSVGDDEELGKVQFTAFLPADEILAMFNAAGRSSGGPAETPADAPG